MYASYNMLYNDCGTAYTDSSRFVCASLPLQQQVRKSIGSSQMFPLNVPCTHNCEINDPQCKYNCSHPPTTKETAHNVQVKENFTPPSRLLGQDQERLLPVMNPTFNMREICKQCILLEDHLCHDEKRCYDCCVKHFLTIEALAEEAITLDPSTTTPHQKIQHLPSHVRKLQSQWHKDPEKNAKQVSQELRKIRKDLQLDAFDVIFQTNPSCKDGICKVSKK